jgi:hypothetical protein
MTQKQKNTTMWVAIGGVAIVLWYMWDKQTGLFAPGGLLANAIPPPGSSSAATTVNATALPATQTAAAANLVAPVAGQVLVPVTVNEAMTGIGKRYRISSSL